MRIAAFNKNITTILNSENGLKFRTARTLGTINPTTDQFYANPASDDSVAGFDLSLYSVQTASLKHQRNLIPLQRQLTSNEKPGPQPSFQ